MLRDVKRCLKGVRFGGLVGLSQVSRCDFGRHEPRSIIAQFRRPTENAIRAWHRRSTASILEQIGGPCELE